MNFFAEARMHMVECQIRTNGVIDEGVLRAFETLPRECFVPTAHQPIAYTDKPLPLPHGRYLPDPMVHAKALQALALKSNECALVIGDASGYVAATLSKLVSTVLVLESRQDTIDRAVKTLDEVGVCNVAYLKGKLQHGVPEQAPYDVILLTGSVAAVPAELLDQLAVGGRLAAVLKNAEHGAGQLVLHTKLQDGSIQTKTLFDAALPYLQGFAPEEVFVF